MKTILTINPRAIAGLLKVCGQKDVRYYLNGVQVEPDTGLLVATDGHVLVAHRSSARLPDVAPFIMPATLLASVAKAKCEDVRVSIGDGAQGHRVVTLECGRMVRFEFEPSGATFAAPEIDGRFPEWRRTVPTDPTGEVTQVNPALLARVQSAMGDICRSRRELITYVSHNGPEAATLITCDEPHTLAVVMAWRCDGKPRATLEALGLVNTTAPEAPVAEVTPEPEALPLAA